LRETSERVRFGEVPLYSEVTQGTKWSIRNDGSVWPICCIAQLRCIVQLRHAMHNHPHHHSVAYAVAVQCVIAHACAVQCIIAHATAVHTHN
jgi:hypothetical protein